MAYLLRQARPDDSPALADLATQLGYPSSGDDISRRLKTIAEQPGNAVLVAVSDDEQVVGWVHVFVACRVESDGFAELGGLVVRDDVRGAGIGRMLVEAAEAWARDEGLAQVRVRSNVVRAATHRFYTHLGYDTTKTQHVFAKLLSG